MSDETLNPAPEETPATPSSRPISGALILLFLFIVAAAVYAFHEHSLAKRLAAQNNQVTSSLNSTRGQVDALTTKLNELSAEQASNKPAAAQAATPARSAHRASAHRREDPRWKQIQSQLSEQQKQIDATRQDLGNAQTELQGSIARTHDELVVLQKKGERNYFEFDIDKSGQFQKDGPVGIRLKKANTKHQYADLEMMVDDFKVSKKHVNVFEPVIFYAAENGQPVELVINKIDKNHIHGYVSEPKYKSSDMQAMANPSGTNTANTAPNGQSAPTAPPAPKPRARLPLPTSN
jgi:hypothetical protein